MKLMPGVNVTNILGAAFRHAEVRVKTALRMLMKLTLERESYL